MTKILRKTEFGNPVLRRATEKLSAEQILSPDIQELIANMYHTLERRKYGVGIAAPQWGEAWRLVLSTPSRHPLDQISSGSN